ncbi:ribonuclease domain-containing protein [Fusobacterium sp. PH5-44]|uniref:ribonuclease domain-containing protein n=1 Tax=unclassified Fusobacterium TaxID=2648384 RepID=UPI003D1FAC25
MMIDIDIRYINDLDPYGDTEIKSDDINLLMEICCRLINSNYLSDYEFKEFENREKRLPEKDEDGNEIIYREHDVHNKIQRKGKGAERFVTGSDGKIYYTDTDYQGFIRVK